MDSLVIRITMWRDDGTVRARVWSDADGHSALFVAASEQEVLALVQQSIETWQRSGPGRGP